MKLRSQFVMVTLALLSACSNSSHDKSQKSMQVALVDDVKTLDPSSAYDSVSLEVLPNIMETLYQYDYASEEYRLVPLLAADMPKFSKNNLVVTIPLRRGIKYADDACFTKTAGKGRELVAADFVYSFKRLAHPGVQSQGAWIFDGRLKGFSEFSQALKNVPKEKLNEEFLNQKIAGISTPDDYTLVLELTKPYPQLLYMLAMTFTAPVPHEAIAKYADEKGQWNHNPVGTGAFKLAKLERGHQVVLEKNPTYRGDPLPKSSHPDSGKPTPFLDKLTFNIIKEDQPMWLRFLKGELELARIPKDNYDQAISKSNKQELTGELKEKGIRLEIEQGVVFYWVNFNVKDKVLSNKYLRQAISSAINREKWIDIFTNGRGVKMTTAAPTGLIDRVQNSKLKYDFNIERAKELLTKAGYPGGKGLPVIQFDMRGSDSTNRQMGEFFTQQLGEIGVKINVVFNTFPAFLEKQKNAQLQMSYGGWYLDYPDVENVYQLLYGKNAPPGPNDTLYDNPEFNHLYEKLSVMMPGKARAQVVKEMDQIVQEDVPWAFGYYRPGYTLYQSWLVNYHGNAFVRDAYKYYRVATDIRQKR